MLVLLPVAVLPIHRCYYRVPFVFCHVCPQPCAFGVLRPYIVTSAVLSNLSGHLFCERLCPLGRAQVAMTAWRRSSPRRLVWLSRVLGSASLLVVAYAYFEAAGAVPGRAETWAQLLSSNDYVPQVWTLAVAGVLLLASVWVRRPFCWMFCPIGATARALDWLLRRVTQERGPGAGVPWESLPSNHQGGKPLS